jgi:hypothetical protein
MFNEVDDTVVDETAEISQVRNGGREGEARGCERGVQRRRRQGSTARRCLCVTARGG